MQPIQLARIAASAADEKKGIDPIVLDVSETLVITDAFVITSATNRRQVLALAQAIEEAVKATGAPGPVAVEGLNEGSWVLLDFAGERNLDAAFHVAVDGQRVVNVRQVALVELHVERGPDDLHNFTGLGRSRCHRKNSEGSMPAGSAGGAIRRVWGPRNLSGERYELV